MKFLGNILGIFDSFCSQNLGGACVWHEGERRWAFSWLILEPGQTLKCRLPMPDAFMQNNTCWLKWAHKGFLIGSDVVTASSGCVSLFHVSGRKDCTSNLYSFVVVLGIEPKALHSLGKCFSTELHPSSSASSFQSFQMLEPAWLLAKGSMECFSSLGLLMLPSHPQWDYKPHCVAQVALDS